MLGSFWGNLLTFIFLSAWTYILIIKKKHSDRFSMVCCAITGLVCEIISVVVGSFNLPVIVIVFANIALTGCFAFTYLVILSNFDKEKSFFLFLIYIAIWNIIGLLASIASNTTIGSFSVLACTIYAILNIVAFLAYREFARERVVKYIISMTYNMAFINIISTYIIIMMLSFMIADYYGGVVSGYTTIFLLVSLPIVILLYIALSKGFFRSLHNTEDYQTRLRNEILNEFVTSNNIMGYYEKASQESKRIIYELARDRDSESILRYLDNNKLEYEVPYMLSTNSTINNVLSAYYVDALHHDIELEVECGHIEKLYVDEYDITALLSNILDFSIKGAKTAREFQYIEINIIQNGDKIYIKGKNTVDKYIRYHDGIPSSDYFDDLGISIMVNTVEKYRGDFEFENDDEFFYFSMNLFNEEGMNI